MKRNKHIVIISPLLNEENNIEIFYKEVQKVLKKSTNFEYSFLFIDDGSKDSSWEVLKKISKNKNVKAIKLSRNFGSHIALFAGIEKAIKSLKVDYVLLTTIDLQNPPELIPKMIKKIEKDSRVVWGYRAKREEGLNHVFSNIYYHLVRRFALSAMPKGGIDYCLIDKKVASEIVAISEKNTSIFGLILWLGYKQEMIPYTRKEIIGRKSRWSLSRKLKLLIDTFVSFSYAPIWMVTYLGFGISFLGFLYALFIIFRRFFYGITIEGWSSLMLVTLILSGIHLIMLGIVAEYLWRTFDSSRSRPMYLIDKET